MASRQRATALQASRRATAHAAKQRVREGAHSLTARRRARLQGKAIEAAGLPLSVSKARHFRTATPHGTEPPRRAALSRSATARPSDGRVRDRAPRPSRCRDSARFQFGVKITDRSVHKIQRGPHCRPSFVKQTCVLAFRSLCAHASGDPWGAETRRRREGSACYELSSGSSPR